METGYLADTPIFTIGYGGLKPADFVSKLTSHGIRAVVDVRLRPHRASMGAYTKAQSADKGIQKLLADAGIEYFSRPELGNVFLEFGDWKTLYAQLLERAGDLLTTRIAEVPRPFCLLCAERNPEDCHREAIARFLSREGHDLVHL